MSEQSKSLDEVILSVLRASDELTESELTECCATYGYDEAEVVEMREHLDAVGELYCVPYDDAPTVYRPTPELEIVRCFQR